MTFRCIALPFFLSYFELLSPGLVIAQSGESGFEGQTFMERMRQGNYRPYLEAAYGIGVPKHKSFAVDFDNNGLAEFRLGFSQIDPYKNYVYTINEGYLFGGFLSRDLALEEDKLHEGNTKATRFGLGNRQGYGYKLGPFTLLPYSYFGMAWTKIEAENKAELSADELAIVERYEGSYRFGQTSEAGMKVRLGKMLAGSAGYEFSVVYPRHLFGKWFGSMLIQSIGYSAIVAYSDAIVDATPALGPLINFALRNGLAFVFYWQMREEMNWPFATERPLTLEALKVSASFTF